MLAAFAALEHRINAAVIGRLSNRQVSAPELGLSFLGMFEDAGTAGIDGLVETTQPRLTVSLQDAAELQEHTLLSLLNPATLVREVYETTNAEPDGAGFIVYQLRKA